MPAAAVRFSAPPGGTAHCRVLVISCVEADGRFIAGESAWAALDFFKRLALRSDICRDLLGNGTTGLIERIRALRKDPDVDVHE
jgi:hypothetical protein